MDLGVSSQIWNKAVIQEFQTPDSGRE